MLTNRFGMCHPQIPKIYSVRLSLKEIGFILSHFDVTISPIGTGNIIQRRMYSTNHQYKTTENLS